MRTLFAVLLTTVVALAAGGPISPPAAVALVKASPQLKIDKSVPPMDNYDAKNHPYVNIAGAPEGVDGGYIDTNYAHQGTLSDGTVVLALPLESGGSGGFFTQVVFAGKTSSSLKYAGYLTSGGHLGVTIENGVIVAKFPDYAANDPNCCPSKYAVDTYNVVNGKLHALSHKTIPAPKH